MIRFLFLLFLVLSTGLSGYAQGGHATKWIFGYNGGLDFSSGKPVPFTGPAIKTIEGSACISDEYGNLLFYTDGSTVWNKNHQKMTNGTGLIGNWSSTQSGIIIKKPGSCNEYIVISVDQGGYQAPNQGIHYSIVDMSLQGGLGAVTTKNVLLLAPPATEKVALVRHANGCDLWVIMHEFLTDKFHTFLLTSAGFGTPKKQAIGRVHPNTSKSSQETLGYMKASPDGKRIALCTGEGMFAEIFDFNNVTGQLSNPITIDFLAGIAAGKYDPAFNSVYGLAFSPDGTKLYLGNDPGLGRIYQFDLSAGTQAAIEATAVMIAGPINRIGGIQLGPDGKLYVSAYGKSLHVIHNPNLAGFACGFQVNGVVLPNGMSSQAGLPSFLDDYTIPPYKPARDTTLACGITSVQISAGAGWPGYSWSTGETTQKITVTKTGQYIVEVKGPCVACIKDTINVTFMNTPAVSLAYTPVCMGDTVTLDTKLTGVPHQWNTGATTPKLKVTQNGWYKVTIGSGNCKAKDSIEVTFNAMPTVALRDTTLCQLDAFTVFLNAGNPGSTYQWQDGSTSQMLEASAAGSFSVVVTNTDGCTASAMATIAIQPPITVNLGSDTAFCAGTAFSLTLDADNAGSSYAWSTGENTQTIVAGNVGTYWVKVTDKLCSASDTLIISWLDLPVIDPQNLTACEGTDIPLTVEYSGGTYLWSTGATTQTIVASSGGPAVYSVTVTSPKGCQATYDYTVSWQPIPIVQLGNDTTICDEKFSLKLDAGTTGSSYLWNDGSTIQIMGVTTPGIYYVTVSNGSCAGTDTLEIKGPVSVELAPDVSSCEETALVLDAINRPGVNYLWSTGETTPQINVNVNGTYWVTINNGKCTDADTINITGGFGEAILFVPNAFTPGNDNLNNFFTGQGTNVSTFSMEIFDRWGDLYFQTNDIARGWDGKLDGTLVQQDVYIYKIKYDATCGGKTKTYNKFGHVSVIR